MTRVRFHQVDEFIDELGKEFRERPGPIPTRPPILRVTNLFSTMPNVAPLQSLTVVATIKDSRGDIIRLERYCGQIWKMEGQDKPTLDRSEEVQKELEEAAKELGLEVRAGVLEE